MDWFVAEFDRSFVIFGDDGQLSMEPVNAADLKPIEVARKSSSYASAAWSSGCNWYFVVMAKGIALLNLDGCGFYCEKRSAMFFDMFLNAPRKRR